MAFHPFSKPWSKTKNCLYVWLYVLDCYHYAELEKMGTFVDHLCYFCLVLLCYHARLFVDALWSPAGKAQTSWLWFVMSNCDAITFPLVSWVRCGA